MGKKNCMKKIREMTGYTQSKFASSYGIPVRTIKSWESGDRIPPKYVLNLLEFKVRHDFAKSKKASKDGLIEALRFGEIPPNGKSINFMKLSLDKNSDFSWALDNYGIEAAYAEVPDKCFEKGVSAFEIDNDMPSCNNIDLLKSLSCRVGCPIYILSGEKVGVGRDGEPLVKVEKFKKISIDQKKLVDYITKQLMTMFPNFEKYKSSTDDEVSTDRIYPFKGCYYHYNGYRFVDDEKKR